MRLCTRKHRSRRYWSSWKTLSHEDGRRESGLQVLAWLGHLRVRRAFSTLDRLQCVLLFRHLRCTVFYARGAVLMTMRHSGLLEGRSGRLSLVY